MARRPRSRLLILALAVLAGMGAGPALAQAPPPAFRPPPPFAAFEACRGREPGEAVRLRLPGGMETATCRQTPQGFVAVPDSHLGRNQPPPQAYEDCQGREPGDEVRHRTPQGVVNAVCVRSPEGLVARPRFNDRQPEIAAPVVRPSADAPKITLLPVPPTTFQAVEIAGKVTGTNRIAAVLVEGSEVPLAPDGGFSARRNVPIGDSEITVLAMDDQGKRSEVQVAVKRLPASNEETAPPLKPSLAHGAPRPNAVALIIGIETYRSAPVAEFAENDARSFYDYAVNALGVPAARVKLLTGANAQKVDVEAAILTWLKPLVVKDQTEVYVFFSGHGLASDDGRELYLLPQDGNRAVLDRSALKRREIVDMIMASKPKSAALFLDACFSGGSRGKESLIVSARPILLSPKDEALPANVTILAASANDQLSSSFAAAKHGLFSYFLMKGLEGEAAGPDKKTITAAGLTAYLADRVPPQAAKLGREQVPQLIGAGEAVLSSW